VKITLNRAGKKYYREWIFRNANAAFLPGKSAVILGPNGSGKSTLLQVIAGAVLPSEGEVIYENNGQPVSQEDVFRHVSFASPYLELIEEFTLKEIVEFHFKFKSTARGMNRQEILELTGLKEKSDQVYKFFSSGMKQRVKLALAIFSDSPVLLLDEPCSNLDKTGVAWYSEMISAYCTERIVIVASNQNKDEYYFCESQFIMSELR
jgi:ABC-type multidrug transport system ATPase subunit